MLLNLSIPERWFLTRDLLLYQNAILLRFYRIWKYCIEIQSIFIFYRLQFFLINGIYEQLNELRLALDCLWIEILLNCIN